MEEWWNYAKDHFWERLIEYTRAMRKVWIVFFIICYLLKKYL
jgi:uncharacterized membrane protein